MKEIGVTLTYRVFFSVQIRKVTRMLLTVHQDQKKCHWLTADELRWGCCASLLTLWGFFASLSHMVLYDDDLSVLVELWHSSYKVKDDWWRNNGGHSFCWWKRRAVKRHGWAGISSNFIPVWRVGAQYFCRSEGTFPGVSETSLVTLFSIVV